MSENPSIDAFERRVSATATSEQPRVWAVATRHLPLYWFPGDCPRANFWAVGRTTSEDLGLLAGASRVHAVEGTWLGRGRAAQVFAYRLPTTTFDPDPEGGEYWLSRDAVAPLETVALGDLLELHALPGSSFA